MNPGILSLCWTLAIYQELLEALGRHLCWRTIEHILASISAPLDVAFQRTRIQWLQQLKAAQQVAGD